MSKIETNNTKDKETLTEACDSADVRMQVRKSAHDAEGHVQQSGQVQNVRVEIIVQGAVVVVSRHQEHFRARVPTYYVGHDVP